MSHNFLPPAVDTQKTAFLVVMKRKTLKNAAPVESPATSKTLVVTNKNSGTSTSNAGDSAKPKKRGLGGATTTDDMELFNDDEQEKQEMNSPSKKSTTGAPVSRKHLTNDELTSLYSKCLELAAKGVTDIV